VNGGVKDGILCKGPDDAGAGVIGNVGFCCVSWASVARRAGSRLIGLRGAAEGVEEVAGKAAESDGAASLLHKQKPGGENETTGTGPSRSEHIVMRTHVVGRGRAAWGGGVVG
jgi:hypothetical protein